MFHKLPCSNFTCWPLTMRPKTVSQGNGPKSALFWPLIKYRLPYGLGRGHRGCRGHRRFEGLSGRQFFCLLTFFSRNDNIRLTFDKCQSSISKSNFGLKNYRLGTSSGPSAASSSASVDPRDHEIRYFWL